MDYLGFIVTLGGIEADQKKVEAIRDFPVPEDLKALRLLELASYYRRFIPGFSKVAALLFALTKRDAPLSGLRTVNKHLIVSKGPWWMQQSWF